MRSTRDGRTTTLIIGPDQEKRLRRLIRREKVKMALVQFFYDRIPIYRKWVEKRYE